MGETNYDKFDQLNTIINAGEDDFLTAVNPHDNLFTDEQEEREDLASTSGKTGKLLIAKSLQFSQTTPSKSSKLPLSMKWIVGHSMEQTEGTGVLPILPSTSTGEGLPDTFDLEAKIKKCPGIMNMFEDIVERRVQQVTGQARVDQSLVTGEVMGSEMCEYSTPVKQMLKPKRGVNVVKSPSDTTLYTPGLRMNTDLQTPSVQACNENIITQVSAFVERVCLEAEEQQPAMQAPGLMVKRQQVQRVVTPLHPRQ